MAKISITQTIKVWKVTVRLLRALYALNGESQVAIIHRLVCDEYKKKIGKLPDDA